jgi:hypothetical protein
LSRFGYLKSPPGSLENSTGFLEAPAGLSNL